MTSPSKQDEDIEIKTDSETISFYGLSWKVWLVIIIAILIVLIWVVLTGKWNDLMKLSKHWIDKHHQKNEKGQSEDKKDEDEVSSEWESELEEEFYSDDESYLIEQSTIKSEGTPKKWPRGTPPASSRKWKREEECRRILESIYRVPFKSCRPNFLKYPQTGRNLELDGYNAELKLAFEHDGVHHYVFPNTWHRTEEDFEQQTSRDRYKRKVCRNLGIYLITIPYDVPFKEMRTYISSKLAIRYDY